MKNEQLVMYKKDGTAVAVNKTSLQAALDSGWLKEDPNKKNKPKKA